MNILDDLKQIKKLDKSKMAGIIAEFPEKCLKAYKEAKKITLPKDYQNIENIVICGMGGSCIGGELVKNLLAEQLKKPVIINRDWNLPGFIDENSLIILVSYSGETQETLCCAETAISRKAKIFIIAQGGKLKKLGKEKNLPLFDFHYPVPARSALAYLLMPILAVLGKIGLIDLKNLKIASSLKELEKFNKLFLPQVCVEKNIAKYLAYSIFDRLPVIIAPTEFSGVARRWKTQMAENGKMFSFFEIEPEIFHNSVESQFPCRLKDDFVFLILETSKKAIKRQKRLKDFEKLLEEKNVCWEKIPSFGNNFLTQTLSLVLLGDWTSFYSAMLGQIDPTPVEQIKKLRRIK